MLVVDGEGKIFDNRRKKQRRVANPALVDEKNDRRRSEDRRKNVQTRGKKK